MVVRRNRRGRGKRSMRRNPILREIMREQGLELPPGANLDGFSEKTAEARRLVAMLRKQDGIPVRQAAHIEPPFRAQPLSFRYQINIAGAGAGLTGRHRFGIHWEPVNDDIGNYGPKNTFRHSGVDLLPQRFPDGMIGVINHIECHAYQHTSITPVDLIREARWSVLWNKQFVPGFQWVPPSGNSHSTLLAVPTTASGDLRNVMQSNKILLRPGDIMEGILGTDGIAAAVTVSYDFSIRGYWFPAKGTDNSIKDMQVD